MAAGRRRPDPVLSYIRDQLEIAERTGLPHIVYGRRVLADLYAKNPPPPDVRPEGEP